MKYISIKPSVFNSNDFKPSNYKNLEQGTFSIIPAFASLNKKRQLPLTLSLGLKMIINGIEESSYIVNYRFLVSFIDDGNHKKDTQKLLEETGFNFMDKLLMAGYYSDQGFDNLEGLLESCNYSLQEVILLEATALRLM